MAHPQQVEFCSKVRRQYPARFQNKIVVDIGSLDINGNNQYLFDNCMYLGNDIAPGKNVDLVCKGEHVGLPDASVDTIISTECFEHDPFVNYTLYNIIRMLKPGGLFLFSCATTGRPEHGTRRTSPQDAPLLTGKWADYYQNMTEKKIRDFFPAFSLPTFDEIFSSYEFSIGHATHDLYFWGFKAGKYVTRNDYSFLLPKRVLAAPISFLP